MGPRSHGGDPAHVSSEQRQKRVRLGQGAQQTRAMQCEKTGGLVSPQPWMHAKELGNQIQPRTRRPWVESFRFAPDPSHPRRTRRRSPPTEQRAAEKLVKMRGLAV